MVYYIYTAAGLCGVLSVFISRVRHRTPQPFFIFAVRQQSQKTHREKKERESTTTRRVKRIHEITKSTSPFMVYPKLCQTFSQIKILIFVPFD